MDSMLTPRRFAASFIFLFATLVSGCTLEVDLTSTPDSVEFDQPVDFGIEVTNHANCPVGGVTALLFPFIPKDSLVSKIEDDHLREFLSEGIDAFCSDGGFEPPPGAEASCEFVDGDLVCTLSGIDGEIPLASQANVPVTAVGEQEVTCESSNGTLTCRVPRALVEMAQQAQEEPEEGVLDNLNCIPVGPIGVCFAAALGSGQSTSGGELQLVPDKVGILRNWVVAFPLVQGGVCKTGLPNLPVPCDPDNNTCLVGSCGIGVCVSGKTSIGISRVGRGCDSSTDCGTTNNPQCDTCNNGSLPAIACTTTTATFNAPAPAMSTWGLAALAMALLAVAMGGLRKIRRQPND